MATIEMRNNQDVEKAIRFFQDAVSETRLTLANWVYGGIGESGEIATDPNPTKYVVIEADINPGFLTGRDRETRLRTLYSGEFIIPDHLDFPDERFKWAIIMGEKFSIRAHLIGGGKKEVYRGVHPLIIKKSYWFSKGRGTLPWEDGYNAERSFSL